jgi:hypothetical protein
LSEKRRYTLRIFIIARMGKLERMGMNALLALGIIKGAVGVEPAMAATPSAQEQRDSAWDPVAAREVADNKKRIYEEQLAAVERARSALEAVKASHEALDTNGHGEPNVELGDLFAAERKLAEEEVELALKRSAWEQAEKHAVKLAEKAVERRAKSHPQHPEKRFIDLYETGNDLSHAYFDKYNLIQGRGGIGLADGTPIVRFASDITDVDFYADPTAPLARDGSPTGLLAVAQSVDGSYTTVVFRDGQVKGSYASDEDGDRKKE